MANYYLSKKAVKDLTAIWKFTAKNWSEKQADIYYTQLTDVFIEIVQNPEIGKHYDAVLPNLLGYLLNNNIVFYLVKETGDVLIIRILHGSMDLKNSINK